MSEADKLARLQLKAAYIEAQRRAAEANATVGAWRRGLGRSRDVRVQPCLQLLHVHARRRPLPAHLHSHAATHSLTPHPAPHTPHPSPHAEDTELPNASEPPPEPSRVAGGRLPLDQQAVLLEAWQFVARWAGWVGVGSCMAGSVGGAGARPAAPPPAS